MLTAKAVNASSLLLTPINETKQNDEIAMGIQ
jgi:hypothetical protein